MFLRRNEQKIGQSLSFSEFAIAMALVNAPVSAPPPPTITDLGFDTVAADVQDVVVPAAAMTLSASEQIFGSIAAVSWQAEPEPASDAPAPLSSPLPPEPITPESQPSDSKPPDSMPLEPAAEPQLTEPFLTDDPNAADPALDQADGNEIIVTARPRAPKSDPLQSLNAEAFGAIQGVDDAVVGPVAEVYEKALPSPVRTGLINFLSNLGEPVNFLNYLLQLKPGKAMETLGRFAINSTIGVAGFVDVAKKPPFNLPRRINGFANTLGYYGVEQGAFLFLPLIGPTTVRDMFGRIVDLSVLPFAIGKPFNDLAYTLPSGIITSLDFRVEQDEQLRKLREANDPYAATRELYLQKRQAEIDALRGKSPEE